MTKRTIHCVYLKKEAEGLDEAPFPGDLGQQVYENISKEAWQSWQAEQTKLINEYRLNLADERAKNFLLEKMVEFLFPKPSHHCWDYDENGPDKWGKLAPAFFLCDVGKKQSPIDIETAKTEENDSHTLSFSYSNSLLHVKHNEHSLYVHSQENDPDQIVTFDEQSYKQVQFHFHAPSEHLLDGQAIPMEIHFVHKNEAGSILVVGVFVQPGAHSDCLETIFSHLPKERGDDIVDFDATVDPADILPEDKNFYLYDGSLTTPPCSEDVTWIVMQHPITASKEQIKFFEEQIINNNIRPVLQLNGRTVYRCGDK
ncbi:MAG: oxidative damage protection protein [Gammaproteobacteria bacterium]|nr:oxidative damage protection protein [Gammaproteobacteria bacterium]MBU1559073.1 oxidative damage protection protein [Gammaproteobacteria bacterium]MBU1926267.1 oxidative damage protection protein [Gammaproteobacteria bacterium]MBU2546195.1 oxidative damage protection protein [Gammaproteobacteria bacterium]